MFTLTQFGFSGWGFSTTSVVNDTNTTNTQPVYSTADWSAHSLESQHVLGFGEHGSEQRLQRATNPIFKIKFKVGNYFKASQQELNLHLVSSKVEITTGLRKPF